MIAPAMPHGMRRALRPDVWVASDTGPRPRSGFEPVSKLQIFGKDKFLTLSVSMTLARRFNAGSTHEEQASRVSDE